MVDTGTSGLPPAFRTVTTRLVPCHNGTPSGEAITYRPAVARMHTASKGMQAGEQAIRSKQLPKQGRPTSAALLAACAKETLYGVTSSSRMTTRAVTIPDAAETGVSRPTRQLVRVTVKSLGASGVLSSISYGKHPVKGGGYQPSKGSVRWRRRAQERRRCVEIRIRQDVQRREDVKRKGEKEPNGASRIRGRTGEVKGLRWFWWAEEPERVCGQSYHCDSRRGRAGTAEGQHAARSGGVVAVEHRRRSLEVASDGLQATWAGSGTQCEGGSEENDTAGNTRVHGAVCWQERAA